MKKLSFIILLAVFITSCETREDINMKRNTAPEVYVGKMGGSADQLDLTDTLKKTDFATYSFRWQDDSNLNLTQTLELEFLEGSENIKDSILVELNTELGEIYVSTNLNDKTIGAPSLRFNIYVVVIDNYSLSAKAKIAITLIENRPPVPQVSFNKISNTEYEISAKSSYDLDSDAIVAYEYLIDGKVIYNKIGYEGEYDTVANPNPGHAATSGTYIISTPLSSIKHNFQVENVNDFKVYVRVKDSRGLWSAWNLFSL